MGFGSDGASVMVGRRAGVATLLKQSNPEMIAIHCVAHRLALAVAQAGDAVPYVKAFKTLLYNLYSFYENSPVRTAGLSAIQSILHDPSLKLKQAKDHRWLSHEGACQTLRRTLQSVYVSLQREASERNEPMADGLYRQTSKFNFVATLYLFCDVLPHICRLSRIFQREAIDLTELSRLVRTTLEILQPLMHTCDPDGHLAKVGEHIDEQLSSYVTPPSQSQKDSFLNQIQKPFIQKLCDNLQQRFPDVELLDAFSIFDPSKLPPTYDIAVRTRYGMERVNVLADHFISLDPQALTLDWQSFRVYMMQSCREMTMKQVLCTLATSSSLGSAYPQLLKLAQICLVVPVSTADCERGFSAMVRVKSKLRNQMSNKTLNQCLRILIEGPEIENFDFVKSLDSWKNKVNRRLVL